MKKSEKIELFNLKSTAYYSWFWGLEVKKIEYWLQDYIYFLANAWYGGTYKDMHKVKVNYNNITWHYILYNGYRCKLDDFIRM